MWFSVVPFPGAMPALLALAAIAETDIDPGSWLTNIFVRVPADPKVAQVCRDLLREAGAVFYEIRR